MVSTTKTKGVFMLLSMFMAVASAWDSRWIEVDVPMSDQVTNTTVSIHLCEHMRNAMIDRFPLYGQPFGNVSVPSNATCLVTTWRNKFYYKTFFEADNLTWRMIKATMFSRAVLEDFVIQANILCDSGIKTNDGLSYKAPATTCPRIIRQQDCCDCQCQCI